MQLGWSVNMVTVLGSKTKPYKKKKTSINQVDYNIEVDFFVTNVEVEVAKRTDQPHFTINPQKIDQLVLSHIL